VGVVEPIARCWLVKKAGRLLLFAEQSRALRARLTSVAAAVHGAVRVNHRSVAWAMQGKVDADWRCRALG
jgi:hypothetical protein